MYTVCLTACRVEGGTNDGTRHRPQNWEELAEACTEIHILIGNILQRAKRGSMKMCI